MKRLMSVVVAWAVAGLVASQASAGVPPCGVTYIEKEIETWNYVCETVCEEVRVRIRKPRYVTVLEKCERKIATPIVSVQRKEVDVPVMTRVPRTVKCDVHRVKYVEQTDYKTVCVDQGHWACSGKCAGACCCRKVWVPCIVEQRVPYTRCVPTVVTETVEKVVYDCVVTSEKRIIQVCDARLEFKTVIEDVPVTKCTWFEEEASITVPRVTVKKVPCKKLVRIPVICGPSGYYDAVTGYPNGEVIVSPKGKDGEVVPPPGKETPKKDEKKDEKPEKK
jgi:hypothetical protein